MIGKTEIKHNDGWLVIEAYSSMYLDYGLRMYVRHDDGSHTYLFDNPSCLSMDSYGMSPSDDYDDYEDALEANANGNPDALEPWTMLEWSTALYDESDILIEAFIGDSLFDDLTEDGPAMVFASDSRSINIEDLLAAEGA